MRVLRSGRYLASYLGPDAMLHYADQTYENKLLASGWLADERKAIERGDWTPPEARRALAIERSHWTVAVYSVRWLEQLERAGIRPATLKDYRTQLKLRILPTLGDLPLNHLTRARVAAWWRGLDIDEHPRACSKGYGTLSSLLSDARADDIIEVNPCHDIKGAGMPSRIRDMPALTPKQLAAVASNMPLHWALGVLIAGWCGLRDSEVRDLRRGDIDTDAGVIHVTHQVVELKGGLVISAAPKTRASVRDAPIPEALIPLVKAHLCDYARPGKAGLLFYRSPANSPKNQDMNRDDSGLLRLPTADLPPADATWRRHWNTACKAAGITGYHFHDLRATALTNTAVAGATIKELQTLAGHTTAGVAMRYQRAADEHWTEVRGRVSAMVVLPA